MAGKIASIYEGNSDISDFEGFTEDLADNISVVPDSDPDSSDIEVSPVESSDISEMPLVMDYIASLMNLS